MGWNFVEQFSLQMQAIGTVVVPEHDEPGIRLSPLFQLARKGGFEVGLSLVGNHEPVLEASS